MLLSAGCWFMLGCWVAQIMVEQAVFIRRCGGWYQLWLAVVATSLGGAGVWCSQWTMSSAITLTRPDNGTTLPLQFSLDVAILAMLPALILTWCGLLVLMRDVEDNSADVANAKHSAARVARQINKEQRAEKRKPCSRCPTRLTCSTSRTAFHAMCWSAVCWLLLVWTCAV